MGNTGIKAMTTKKKHSEEVKVDATNGNGKPDGYIFEMPQGGKEGDSLDTEFERY